MQLLLWPTFRTSHLSTLHSPALRGLVFTGHASTTYTLTTHRVFPLKTTAATSAELTEISSTISDNAKNSNLNPPSSAENGMNQPPPITPCSSSSSSAGMEQMVLNGISPYLSTPLPSGQHKGSLHVGQHKPQETSNTSSPLVEGTSIPNGVMNGSTAMETETPGGGGGEQAHKKTAKGRKSQSPKSVSPTLVQLPCSEYHCIPTDMPKFLTTYIPKVSLIKISPLTSSYTFLSFTLTSTPLFSTTSPLSPPPSHLPLLHTLPISSILSSTTSSILPSLLTCLTPPSFLLLHPVLHTLPTSSILFRYRFPGTPSTALTAVQSLQDRRSGLQGDHCASSNCSSMGEAERGRRFHKWSCFLHHQLGLMPCALLLGGHTSTYQVGT